MVFDAEMHTLDITSDVASARNWTIRGDANGSRRGCLARF
jgi:hypothetical protein